jgi:purine-binding chemotaxis protein CheW
VVVVRCWRVDVMAEAMRATHASTGIPRRAGALKLPHGWTDYRGMSEDAPTRQLVVFNLGDEEYALAISDVHEIIRYTEPRSVASTVGWIRGVISLRGKIVPVYDLASRLREGRDSHPAEQKKIVIVETDERMAGIIVDDVTEVLTIECDQVESVPSAAEPSVEAIAKIDDRLIVMLRPAGLFAGAAEVTA